MNKKILLGSIGAAIIIVFATFSSVVGMQNIDSSVKESPLFGIRTNGAVNPNDKAAKNDYYVGKNKELPIFIPTLSDLTKYYGNPVDGDFTVGFPNEWFCMILALLSIMLPVCPPGYTVTWPAACSGGATSDAATCSGVTCSGATCGGTVTCQILCTVTTPTCRGYPGVTCMVTGCATNCQTCDWPRC